MSEVKLEDIVSLCKRRGFVYPGSDVYGGLSGTWDYGPLGVALKRNIMQLWWKMFVDDVDNMHGVDAAILMNQKVWQASGHTETFTDPLVECSNCHARFRVDKIVDAQYYKDYVGELEKANSEALEDTVTNEIGDQIRAARAFMGPFAQKAINGHVKCSVCSKSTWDEPKQFNMMFKTNVGPVADEYSVSYLRPETAQGIFTNFKNVVDSFYPDIPFGLAQQGKAFRNEISPRDFVFRSREFEQMEIEYFVHPDNWEAAFEEWIKKVHEWTDALGLPATSVHELEVEEADRAHYSKRTVDFEFDFPIGREELLGLAYRTDFDLINIQNASKKSMEYRPKDGGAPFVPHVIEPSFGVERAFMAVLSAAYKEDEQNGEKRRYLALPKHLAPVKVAVSPLLKNKPELVDKAREVYSMLKKEFGAVMWDDNGNIGKRYRRQDEIGTPYCVVIDFDTLEGDTAGTVTVRDRDTTEQTRVPIDELIAKLT
ncbi:MAG TPA: glycine--tRNA ligase [Candidatus Saccharimonadales bacterium]|jgi:glycyl-tRNA synthetase